MRPCPALFCVAIIPIVAIVAPATTLAQNPAARPIDAAQVVAAIDHGVAYLKRQQGPRGSWNELPGYDGGVTALCTLALINSGVPSDDPVVSKAVDHLRGLQLDKTYTIALQTMVLCAADPKRDLLIIRRNVKWLEDNQIKEGQRKGAWSYPGPGNTGGDNSNSQFAVLALYDAQHVGVDVSRDTWTLAANYWRSTQNDDGSWGYVPGDAGTGSMTCAGIGGLAVSTAALESGDASVEDGKVVCCRPHEVDDKLDRAVDWLATHFSVNHNPRPAGGGQACLYYYLYGLERAGRLTGRRFIGDHDWYREGAELLIREQDSLSHFWKGSWYAETKEWISTPMALLFLSKGRRPVVMAKLKYGENDIWNQHRRDAAHLTEYTEDAWGFGLTWQVMDPAKASVEDLLQAPVLYISGSQAPTLLPQAQKLRDYVDRGGFIFAEACCKDSSRFDVALRQLMTAVFPEPEYKMQPIPPGHPVWRMQDMVRPDSPFAGHLYGVEYGCRTCVVYCDQDLSCYWELARPGQWSHYPADVIQHITDALAIGVNVLTYATNREPKGKEQSFETPLAADAVSDKTARGVIEIAKLRHGGGCNDAPGALLNLLRTASQGELKLQVRAAPDLISISDPSLFRYHLAFMHGRYDFHLTEAERTQLREYLERGGTVLADSICASKPFATALRREIAAALPGKSFERIPPTDPIFTNAFGGYDIRNVSLRDPAVASGGNQPVAARIRQVAPEIEGIQIDHRWAVIFSPYDISCALESHEAVGCRGYIQQDAARIGLNVLLYSLNQ